MSNLDNEAKRYLLSLGMLPLMVLYYYQQRGAVDAVFYPLVLVLPTMLARFILLRRWDGPGGEKEDADERATAIQGKAARLTFQLTAGGLILYAVTRPAWPPYLVAWWFLAFLMIANTVMELVLRKVA